MVPDPKRDFSSSPASGEDVAFLGSNESPNFLIKQIQVDGEGRLGGQRYNFAGIARNISSQPSLLGSPVVFELRAQGSAHAFVNCVIDRSTPQSTDYLKITCPDLKLPARILGDKESLRVNVSPCRTSVDLELRCNDDQMNGKIITDHSNLVMQIDFLDDLAGGSEVADRINLELASISDYRVVTQINGPTHSPAMTFNSDLGDRLAVKFNEIINARTSVVDNSFEQRLNSRIAMLDQEIAAQIQSLSEQLESEIVGQKTILASKISKRLKTGSDQKILR